MTEEYPDAQPKRRLGRGLNSLLGRGMAAEEGSQPVDPGSLRDLPIGNIERNPWQPRKDFDAEGMRELSDSIREHGLLQPILVRELPEGGFQLIAGERRWKAAEQAGLSTIPARVVDVIDQTACEFALEENLKRKDLSDLEKAQAFAEYLKQFGTPVETLAKQLSMSRSAVANMLRLLDLAEPVRLALQQGKISTGHARALHPLDEAGQIAMCGRVQAESLNVRQTETAVRAHLSEQPDVVPIKLEPDSPKKPDLSNHVLSVQEHLRELLGVKVDIKLKTNDRGQIVIPFNSNDEFEDVLRRLRRAAA
ncbi:MAG: ParB/RepB/Spo0J family partition protein [Planctomycetaceae bacterium]|nr:ParB/RepB/Spo0J family partition protein [Planctomycetaceae bacterium]